MSATIAKPDPPNRTPLVVQGISTGALFVALALLGFGFVGYVTAEDRETRRVLEELHAEFNGVNELNVRIHRAMLCILAIPVPNRADAIHDCQVAFLEPGDLRPVRDQEGGGQPPGSGGQEPPAATETPEPRPTPPDGTEPPPPSPSPSPVPSPQPPPPEPSPSPDPLPDTICDLLPAIC